MKLQQIKRILVENLPKMKYETKLISNQNIIELSGLILYREAVFNLEKISLLKDDFDRLKKRLIFQTGNDIIQVNQEESRLIYSLNANLIKILSTLLESVESISTEIKENVISIKLPEAGDMDDLAKYLLKFDKAIKQSIINDTIKGEVKIIGVENGSIWIDIFLGSILAVKIIGSLAWASAVVYKKIMEANVVKEHVEGLKIKNDSLENIKEAQKVMIDMLIDAEARSIYDEYYQVDTDKEQIERIKFTIREFSELLQDGAEIIPALNAPEEVKNLFPDSANLLNIVSKIKQIEKV